MPIVRITRDSRYRGDRTALRAWVGGVCVSAVRGNHPRNLDTLREAVEHALGMGLGGDEWETLWRDRILRSVKPLFYPVADGRPSPVPVEAGDGVCGTSGPWDDWDYGEVLSWNVSQRTVRIAWGASGAVTDVVVDGLTDVGVFRSFEDAQAEYEAAVAERKHAEGAR